MRLVIAYRLARYYRTSGMPLTYSLSTAWKNAK